MKKSKLLPIIGIALFLYIISRVNVGKVIENFSRIDVFWFFVALGILVFQHIVKAVRWKILIDTYGIKYPLMDSLKGWLIGYSFSLITPGKIGDFARAYCLKDKMETGKAITTVMADRVIDIFVLFIMATIGISIFVNTYVKNDFLLYGTYMLFALFVSAIFIFSKKRIATAMLRPFHSKLTPKKYKSRAEKLYNDFYSGLDVLFKKKKAIFLTSIITLAFWFIAILGIYTIAISMGIASASYTFLLIIMPIIMIILALPISFSGVGTRDATLIFFFSYISLSAEMAISFSLMILIFDYILAVPGFILLFRHPLKIGKDK